MDYFRMTAPCGLDCFNCRLYLAQEDQETRKEVEELAREWDVPMEKMLCKGCRDHDGRIPIQIHLFGEAHRCAAYECAKEKNLGFCGECEDFPCDNLHPYADRAAEVPHNTKVFNLCLINKLGLEKWAQSKAGEVRKTYFTKPWSLS